MDGLIHIYTGDGKGKTSAATGLAVRFAGSGRKVLYTQFLKSNDSGELKILEQLENVELVRCESCFGFTFQMTDEIKEEAKAFYTEHFRHITECVLTTSHGLLILDEMITAYEKDMIDRKTVLEFLKSKPGELEVVMTGRGALPELLELADYVTEMKKVKHPYDAGILARSGIEM